MPGYTGENCLTPCPYPYYGVDCQKECKCSNGSCDISTGCISLTTGTNFAKTVWYQDHGKNKKIMMPPIAPSSCSVESF